MSQATEKIFIERLKRKEAEWSQEALAKPKDKTAFGYGQASGVLIGLHLAGQLFEEILEEDHDGT